MIVGLTGGLATGKSLVAGELARLGARVIDADLVAREVVEPGKPAYDDIVREFGPGVLNPDKTIDRAALGRIVFGDRAALDRLNAITHPRIRERMKQEAARLEAAGEGIVVLDVPLLIETGVKYDVEKIIVVYADAARQIERAMLRDGLGLEDARKRLSSQIDIKEKARSADYVIDNSGTRDETIEQTRRVYSELIALENVKKGT